MLRPYGNLRCEVGDPMSNMCGKLQSRRFAVPKADGSVMPWFLPSTGWTSQSMASTSIAELRRIRSSEIHDPATVVELGRYVLKTGGRGAGDECMSNTLKS